MAEIIQRETALMKQECWNVNLAINHILKVVRAEAKQYLNGSTLGTTGKLNRDRVYQASLCGMSVKDVDCIVREIARRNGQEQFDIEPLSDLELARLLQVCKLDSAISSV